MDGTQNCTCLDPKEVRDFPHIWLYIINRAMLTTTKRKDFMEQGYVVIVSGGMDSITLLHMLVERVGANRVYAISFFYGQTHKKELECAKNQCAKLGVKWILIELASMLQIVKSSLTGQGEIPTIQEVVGDPQPSTYVPFRNQLMLTFAAVLAESCGMTHIAFGAQAHDLYGYWDTTPEFQAGFQSLLNLNRRHTLQLEAPLMGMSKTEVLRLAHSLNVDLAQTWSCYKGGEKACGRCPTCAERLAAFANLQETDPLPYEE